MATRTTAALLVAHGQPLVIAEVDLPDPGPGHVLVQVSYSAVCHTQLLEAKGLRGPDPWLPHCLGHEGSGIVAAVGPGVQRVQPGDEVVLSWMKAQGHDAGGSKLAWQGRVVHAGPVTTFSRHTVVAENRLTKVPRGLSLRSAALLGCAVPTGFGAVLNTAAARPGQSVVVFGMGGVGLAALLGARAAGCDPLVAVDVRAERLATARRAGATAVVDATRGDAREAILAEAGGALDIAIEATGRPQVMELALAVVRPRGGRAVIVGNAPFGERVQLDPQELNQGKQILGTWGGDCDPDRDFPRFARLVAKNPGWLATLTGDVYRLEDIDAALKDLEAGKALRPLLDLGLR